MAQDTSYDTQVYLEQGGAVLHVGATGKIQVHTGGQIVPDSGTLPSAITKPVTTASTQSTPFGFATQAQGDAIVTAVNAIIDALKAAGLTS